MTTTTHTQATLPTTRTGRTGRVTVRVLQGVMAAAFAMAAATKYTNYPEAVAGFDHIGLGHGFMYLIATLELAGAIVTQLLLFAPETALTPLAYLVPVAIIAWARRDRTGRLVRPLTGRG